MKKGKLIAIAGMVLVMGSAFPVSAAESLADFDYRTYADTYPDLKAAFGYDAAALYNHYETNGKAEGRVAVFTEAATTQTATTTETTASEKLDPLPPLNPSKMPDWFDVRTPVESMTNARLVAEYNALVPLWKSMICPLRVLYSCGCRFSKCIFIILIIIISCQADIHFGEQLFLTRQMPVEVC